MGSPARQALVVGINRYSALRPANQLYGCVNDARLMVEVLRGRFGFVDGQIRLLLDGEATQHAILAALDEVLVRVSEDGVVLFHFSGHGSQIEDPWENEGDGWNETLVPCDSGRYGEPSRDIVDDSVAEWLRALNRRTRNVTLIVDACHSGTITRDAFACRVRGIEAVRRGRWRLRGGSRKVAGGLLAGGPAAAAGWVLMAAAGDDQSAYESHARDAGCHHGAFSYELCRELLRPGSEHRTYRDLFELVAPRVSERFAAQRPQLEGERDRLLLAGGAQPTHRFVNLIRATVEGGELAVGAAHGLVAGSTWAICPPGTMVPDPQSTPIAELGIDEVGVVRSRGGWRVAPAVLPPAGSRAFELSADYGSMRLAVAVPSRVKGYRVGRRLAEAVTSSPLLVEVEESEAELSLLLRDHRRAKRWRAVDRSGYDAFPPRAEIDDFVARLERTARWRQLLRLENPRSLLSGGVDLIVHLHGEDGPCPLPAGAVLSPGDQLSVEIANRTEHQLHVALIDLEADDRVRLVHPPAGADEALSAGRRMFIGRRQGEVLRVVGPPPAVRAHDGPAVEYLRLFVSTAPTDFSLLTRLGGFVDRATTSRLERLLAHAWNGHAQRCWSLAAPFAPEDWMATTRVLRVLRSAH